MVYGKTKYVCFINCCDVPQSNNLIPFCQNDIPNYYIYVDNIYCLFYIVLRNVLTREVRRFFCHGTLNTCYSTVYFIESLTCYRISPKVK